MPARRRTSRDTHWTLILLRNELAPPITLRVPRCLAGLVLCIVLLALATAPLAWSDYQYWRDRGERVDELEAVIVRQQETLADLTDQVREVEMSLEEVAELDRQLRAALGLEATGDAAAASLLPPPSDQASVQVQLGAGPENARAPARHLDAAGDDLPLSVESQLWLLAGRVQDYLQNLLELRREMGAQMSADAEPSHCWPISGGYVSSNYGWRISPVTGVWQFHRALDIAAPLGTPIVASAPGTVIFLGRLPYYGETLKIRHADGVMTVYSHCNEITASVGERVSAGQIIAHVGTTGRTTGPHLHWELHRDGEPVNPWSYLPQ
ncbi:MAG: peptidoglycan DD-metalloendopeptidase family protein [Bacillota bacterium]